jgi:hypothetical protein
MLGAPLILYSILLAGIVALVAGPAHLSRHPPLPFLAEPVRG